MLYPHGYLKTLPTRTICADPVRYYKKIVTTYMNLLVVNQYLVRYDPNGDIASEKAFHHHFYRPYGFPLVDMGILSLTCYPLPKNLHLRMNISTGFHL